MANLWQLWRMDPELDRKLTEAAVRYRGAPEGLPIELERIKKDHDESAAAWKKLGPLVIGLVVTVLFVAFAR